ncbi:hypothetical protein Tco_0918864 [Tanacetum coccineum]
MFREVFVTDEPIVDRSKRNLIPPQVVTGTTGQLIADELMVLIESRHDMVQAREIIDKNLDGHDFIASARTSGYSSQNIVKEVEDYLKTYPSADMDISWVFVEEKGENDKRVNKNVKSSVDEASIANDDVVISEVDKRSNDIDEQFISNFDGNNRVDKNNGDSYAKTVKKDLKNVNNKLNFVLTEISEEGSEIVIFDEELNEKGKPLIMDNMTTKRCQFREGRMDFARVLVEFDVLKGFKEKIEIQYMDKNNNKGSKYVTVKYAWKP